MLSFFRNFTKSRIGLIVVFAVLGLIALAFAASDVTGLRAPNSGSSATLITVGSREIDQSEVSLRVNAAMTNLRRQGRAITMEEFLAQGGLEAVLDQTINGVVLEEFGRQSGIRVSKALIDGQIASIPAFQGVNGKFDQKKFEQLLADERLNPKDLRDDMTRERYGTWLLERATPGTQIPDGVIAPYASLLLERRTGIAGMVRTMDMDPGPDPDDKALTAFYNANRARYTVPQRRIIRYAIVNPDRFRAQAAATEAEIAQAYRNAGTKYAASEKRTVRQVVLADQATANRVAAQVRGGQSITDAARAAGLESSEFADLDKAALAQRTSPAIADAAFGGAEGAVVGPVRSPLGWNVLRVDGIQRVAARPLAEVRTELADEVSQYKIATAIAATRQSIEDGIGDGQTFDELTQQAKLQASRTPPLTAAGINPDDPAFKPDPALAPIVRGGYAINPEDQEPQLVPTGQDGSFAVIGLERVVPAAPRPLASIRDRVKDDFLVDKALQKARTTATGIVQKLKSGVPMAQALSEAGIRQPPPKPFDLKRSDLAGKQVPQHVATAFSMAPKTAKLVPAPDRAGFYIVYLDAVEEHDASRDADLMNRTRAEVGAMVPREQAMQFLESIKRALKIERNEAAIARFKAGLAGGSPSQ